MNGVEQVDDDWGALVATRRARKRRYERAGLTPAAPETVQPPAPSLRDSAARLAAAAPVSPDVGRVGRSRGAPMAPADDRDELSPLDVLNLRADQENESTLGRMGRQVREVAGLARGGVAAVPAMAAEMVTHPLDLVTAPFRGVRTAARYTARGIESALGKEMETSGIPETSLPEAALGAVDVAMLGVPLTRGAGALARRGLAERGARQAAGERFSAGLARAEREAVPYREMKRETAGMEARVGSRRLPPGQYEPQLGPGIAQPGVGVPRMNAAEMASEADVAVHRGQRQSLPISEVPREMRPEREVLGGRRAQSPAQREGNLESNLERRAIQDESAAVEQARARKAAEDVEDLARPHDEARLSSGRNRPNLERVKTSGLQAEHDRLSKLVAEKQPRTEGQTTQGDIDAFANTDEALKSAGPGHGRLTKGELMQERVGDEGSIAEGRLVGGKLQLQLESRLADVRAQLEKRGVAEGSWVDPSTNRPGQIDRRLLLTGGGAAAGAAVGATQGDTPGERIRNATLGALGGAGAGYMGSRFINAAERASKIQGEWTTGSRFERAMQPLPPMVDDWVAPRSVSGARPAPPPVSAEADLAFGQRITERRATDRANRIVPLEGEGTHETFLRTSKPIDQGRTFGGPETAPPVGPLVEPEKLLRMKNRIGAIGDIRGKGKSTPSLFAGEQGDLLGPSSLAESNVGKRAAKPAEPEKSVDWVASYYDTPGARDLAHRVKNGDADAIVQMADEMAPRVPKNAVLIPMPSRSGSATVTKQLAERIAGQAGVEVSDVLVGAARESAYAAKAAGRGVSAAEMQIRLSGSLPPGKVPIIIDNVIGTGGTARAAIEAVPGSRVLAHSADEAAYRGASTKGKITAEEMAARREELGAPKSEAEATAGADQIGLEFETKPSSEFLASRKRLGDANAAQGQAQREYVRGKIPESEYTAAKTSAAKAATDHEAATAAEQGRLSAERREAAYLQSQRGQPHDLPSQGGGVDMRQMSDEQIEQMRVSARKVSPADYPPITADLAALDAEAARRAALPPKSDLKLFDIGGAVGEALKTPLGQKAAAMTAGAAVGSAADKENPTRGFIAGGLAGAAGSMAFRRAGEKIAAARGARAGAAAVATAGRTAEKVAARAAAAPEKSAARAVKASERIREPVRPYPKDSFEEPRTPEELLEHSFKLLKGDGQDEIQATMTRLIESGKIPTGGRISNAQAREIADTFGPEAQGLATKDPANALSGVELLALKDVTKLNINRQALARQIIKDASASPEGIALATQLRDALEDRIVKQVTRGLRDASQKGRDLQMMKMVAEASDDPADWLLRARKLAGTGDINAALDARIRVAVAKKNFSEATRAIGEARKAGLAEKVGELYQTGLLSAFGRPFRDLMSNLINVGNTVVENQIATSLDQVVSAFTGLRSFDAPATKMIAKGGRGAVQGVKQAWAILRGESGNTAALERAARRYDMLAESSQSNPLLRSYTTLVRRSVAGPDQVGYEAGLAMALEEQARMYARSAGAKPGTAEFDKVVESMAANPTPPMQLTAEIAALEGVWQNKTALGSVFTRPNVKTHPLLNLGSKVIVPFTQTPAAMTTQTVASTPIALVSTLPDLLQMLQKTEMAEAQRRLVKKLGRISVGGAWMGAGYLLAGDGDMTSWYPSDAGEAAQWKENGKLENAVRVGGKWVALTGAIGPQAQLMSIGAGIHHLINDLGHSTPGAVALGSTVGVAKTMLDTPMMQGPKTAIEATTRVAAGGEELSEAMGSVAESYVGGWVPQFVQRLARSRDTDANGQIIMRETRGEGGLPGGMKRAVQQGIPGLRESLPPKETPFGRARTSGTGGPLSLVTPFRTSQDFSSDPVVKEFDRLKVGVGDRRKLDGETRLAYAARAGAEGGQLKRVMGLIINSPEYKAWPPDQEIVDAVENDKSFEDATDKRSLQEKVQSAYLKYIIERARTAQTQARQPQ